MEIDKNTLVSRSESEGFSANNLKKPDAIPLQPESSDAGSSQSTDAQIVYIDPSTWEGEII